MKQMSMWLAVSLLGAMPLTAAAVDYGPNQVLLAAENGAPQLPDVQRNTAATDMAPMPAGASGGLEGLSELPPSVARVAPSAASAASTATPRKVRTSTNHKPRIAPAKPPVEPGPAPWQSLLPGSIQ